MSANGNGDEEIPGREIAYRVFAAEYDDADFSYAESDEERAPNYVITPTGARLNRIFAVGTLTEITPVNDEMVRARVVDPTGAFVVYAGQYQPDELAALERLEPPAFVAVTGKARTFQPDDSDRVYTSVRPESIATVDADTRDRWVVNAAEQTLDRIGTYATAAALDATDEALTQLLEDHGVENGLTAGLPLAMDHYGTTSDYLAALRDCAIEAVEVVAGDRDQVSPLEIGPEGTRADAETSFADLASLTDLELSVGDSIEEPDTEQAESIDAAADETGAEPGTASEPAGAETDDLGTGSAAGTASAQLEAEDGSDTLDTSGSSDADDEAVVTASTSETTVDTSDGEIDIDAEAESGAAAGSDELGDFDADTGVDTDSTSDSDELGDFDGGGSTTVDADSSAESGGTDETIDAETGPDRDTADEATDDDIDDVAVDADSDEATGDDELDDFDSGEMYEMGDEEREQIEEEFGTEFSTGTEVDDPGESDIDAPSADDVSGAETAASSEDADTDEPVADSETADSVDETESDAADEPVADDTDESASDDTADEPPADDIDLEDYVVETMTELDDGDGADRTALVETVADDVGVDEADVEDAIQDALMGGQCYEPDDDTLKPI